MAFIEGTKIFTNSGWKNVEQISGQDKVLVRNFIGDAEFLQPFALIKSQYNGLINKIGSKRWSFSVTPDHIVMYDRDDTPQSKNLTFLPAKDVEVHGNNRIMRKFRFSNRDDYKKEQIVINTQFGKKYSTISNEDWFVLCAYVLRKGMIEKQVGRSNLNLFVSDEKDIEKLTGILDRIGVQWSLLKRDRYFIRISNNNNLAKRISTRLRGSVRKKMYLSDKMIYNSNRALVEMFFDTLLFAGDQLNCSSRLADSLVLLGTLHGYSVTKNLLLEKGAETKKAIVTRDIYNVVVNKPTISYSPMFNTQEKYKGAVYSIDLFDGQVYVREKGMPVWVNPK